VYDEYGEFRGCVLIKMAGSLLQCTWHEAKFW
jgi:hypothetical protein